MSNKFSDFFREMADRIDRNLETEFAGAVLIVPPVGTPIAVLVTDPSKDAEAFWATASAKVEIATQDFRLSKTGGNQGFNRR